MRNNEDNEIYNFDNETQSNVYTDELYYDENGQPYAYDENGQPYYVDVESDAYGTDSYQNGSYYEDSDPYYDKYANRKSGRSPKHEPAKRRSIFWGIYIVLTSLFVLLWLFLILYVKKCLVIYENAQPDHVIESMAQALQNGDTEALSGFGEGSRFESPDIIKETYLAKLGGKEITYEKRPESTEKEPVYGLYAGDERIATIGLKEISSEPLMLILTLQKWEVTGASANVDSGENVVKVLIPTGYKALINGIEADERELTADAVPMEGFENLASYVTLPSMNEYTIEGLMFAPDVKVYDASGKEAPLSVEGTTYKAGFASSDEVPSDISAMALKYAEDYTNFFSGDLEGCYTSINCLRPMFPSDSYFLQFAEIYRCEDMGFYAAHLTPSFSNEKVSNYTVYGEDLFTVDVSFDKTMHLTRNGEDKVDVTNQRYYYILENGNWVIGDMVQIIE